MPLRLNIPLSASSRSSSGWGSRIVMTASALIFIFFSGPVEKRIAGDYLAGLRTRSWAATPCTILQSSVQQDPGRSGTPYSFSVRYSYEFAGVPHVGTRYELSDGSGSDVTPFQRRLALYPAGRRATCYVNSQAPDEAILHHPSLVGGFGLLFPVPFFLAGALLLLFAWRPVLRRSSATSTGPLASTAAPSASITEQARKSVAVGRGFLLVFFSIFLIAGLAGFYVFAARPLYRVWASRDWSAVPCTVLSSRVRSHESHDADGDSSTYSIDILYEYRVGGRAWQSNRYGFMGGSSSGYEGKARIVARHPAGSQATCYVNPADPSSAVLERGLTPEMLWGLIPLIFVAVGGGGLAWGLRLGRPGASRFEPSAPAGPLALHSSQSPLTRFLGSILFTLFWNGVVSVFVYQGVQTWRSGQPNWFLTLFLVPFVLVGLGCLGYVVYAFLGLFNPRVRLTLDTHPLVLGGSGHVSWCLTGRVVALRSLRIGLEGREEALHTERSGRDRRTRTDKTVFIRIPLFETMQPLLMTDGRAGLTIPPDTMHSFKAPHNRIVWVVTVKGDIPHWPDIAEEYPVEILPSPAAGGDFR